MHLSRWSAALPATATIPGRLKTAVISSRARFTRNLMSLRRYAGMSTRHHSLRSGSYWVRSAARM